MAAPQPAGCAAGVKHASSGVRRTLGAEPSVLLLIVVNTVMLGVVAGCRHDATVAPGPIAARLLLLSQTAGRELGVTLQPEEETVAQLSALVQRARVALRSARGLSRVDALNRFVFEEERFQRITDRSRVDAMLLPRVLATRRGSCVGLGALYLVLGEALELPLAGVLVPGHFFVRYQEGSLTRDIELLKRGRAMSRRWYARKYPMPVPHPLYLRSLTAEQSVEVLRFNLANELRQRGDLSGAAGHYRHVTAVLPLFAEAQANLGLTYQLLGSPERALQAYHAAEGSNPHLIGLKENLRRVQSAGVAEVDTGLSK